MNEDVATELNSRLEPRASLRAQTLVMDLGPCVRPQADRESRQARESPEVIEEIECEAPNTQDPPPHLLRTFMCHGDTIEVVEDEKVSEKVKELRVALASVSGQIKVS